MPIVQEAIRRNLISVKDLFDSQPDWADKRNKAIKKLFSGNAADFSRFVAPIENMEEWKEVLAYLEAEFSKRNIKPDSKEATGLTDVLFKRYFPSY